MRIFKEQLRLSATIFLLASALSVAAFYSALFLHDNAAPLVDLAGFRVSDRAGFKYRMDRCWSSDDKIAVKGWVVREGSGAVRRSVRVVLLDADTGRAHALKTVLQARDDVVTQFDQHPGDGIEYSYPGFAASLDLEGAQQGVAGGQLYIAYRDARARVLLPLPCRAKWPR